MTKTIGIMPIAGTASRMKGLPKFLLPTATNTTLIDNAITIFKNNNINTIYAGVSDTNNYLLQNYTSFNKVLVNTKTMAETVKLLTDVTDFEHGDEPYNLVLIMPDTFFTIRNELNVAKEHLENGADIVLICWKIKDYQIGKVGQVKIENDNVLDIIDKDPTCVYPYFWGIICWKNTLNQIIDPQWQTIGNMVNHSKNITIKAVISESTYYDCGTFDEYLRMIRS